MGDHIFVKEYCSSPTNCSVCKQFIWGITKKQQKAYKCTQCKGFSHSKCRVTAGPCSKNPQTNIRKADQHASQPTQQERQQQQQQQAVQQEKRYAKAAFDFPPENERELELKKGDVVEVLQEVEEWWYGILPNGKEGYFPSNYVEKIGNWV